MNEIKKCLFCDCDLEYHNVLLYERYAQKVFICKNCLIKYIFFEKGDMAMYSFFIKIGNNIYIWSFNNLSKTSQIRFKSCSEDLTYEYLVGTIHSRLFVPEVAKLLITIENTPKITPDNIEQKLKTYLLFL